MGWEKRKKKVGGKKKDQSAYCFITDMLFMKDFSKGVSREKKTEKL